MMPGEKQSEAGGVASEASAGTCETCGLLTRSLDEYMAALLTLKQKIIDTDHLLSEYKEKCDELQQSQRESSKLHKQLDEVLLKLGPLEKQMVDFEAVKVELEEAKAALKTYQQKSEEVDSLREQNSKTLALNKKLEDNIKMAEDAAKSESLENTKLRSEKKTLEEDLQKTQEYLGMCQQAAEEVENLRLQNAKTLIFKSNLENQLLALEDTKFKQSNEITDLKRENGVLQENLLEMQNKLEKLENEVNKEKRSASTQTRLEPKVDKVKVRMLLEELWHCVEPLPQTTEMLDFSAETTDNQHLSIFSKFRLQKLPFQPLPASPCRKQIPHLAPSTPAKGMKSQAPGTSSSIWKVSPGRSKSESSFEDKTTPSKVQSNKNPGRKKKGSLGSEELSHIGTWIDKANIDGNNGHSSDRDGSRNGTDLWDILDFFKPLPTALSPLHVSDELTEMDSDPSISSPKEDSLSNDKDAKQLTKSTEPNPLKDDVVTASVISSPGCFIKSDLFNTEVSSFPHNTTDESFLSESQEMEVDKPSEVKENLPCAVTVADLQNEHESITVKPDRITVTAESQLNAMEKHLRVRSPSVGSESPNALCNEAIHKGSDSGQNVDHKCLDTHDDASHDCHSGDKVNMTEKSSEIPGRDSETVPESSVQKIPNSLTPEAPIEGDLKTSDNQNNVNGQEHDSSSMKVNGVSLVGSSKHEELSDDEEFFGLKRKVRGNFSKPGPKSSPDNLNCISVCTPQAVGKETSEEKFQKTNSKTEDERHLELSKTIPDPENEKGASSLVDKSVMEHTSEPEMPEDDGNQEAAPAQKHKDELVNLPQKSLQIVDTQEENSLSEALKPTVEKADTIPFTGPKELDTKAEDSSVKPQDVCSAVPNPVKLSGTDREVNLSPLTAFASRNALTSTPSPESIGHVRMAMGPPLPPAVMPLTATPPKFGKPHTLISPSGQLPSWLPSEGPLSQDPQQTMSFLESGLQDEAKRSPCLTTPSPSRGVPSSPLQFGSATPKHAVPVPGRLPSALNSSSPTTSQENSMQILDTMYPELSAQARTLNILRGNVTLGRTGSESGASPPSVNQISGNKTINSSSTAFTKTEQKVKRTGVNVLLPKSAKKLRLDACSPAAVDTTSPMAVNNDQATDVVESSESHPMNSPSGSNQEQGTESKPQTKQNDKEVKISDAIEKLQSSCFDVLPVIKSHVFLGRISEVPVLRDEEKSVISEFCSNQSPAEEFMAAILSKIKAQRDVLKQEFLQSICRVYIGLCRQRGDIQKAHALAYSILKENFPEAPKLILFMVTTWPSMLCYDNCLCKAIHTVSKLKAEGEILDCLTVYLHWDKTPPSDIHKMISSILKALLEDDNLKFLKHDRHGDDLCPTAWEYIFTLDLLCAHLGWKWTHDNIIGKELWPVMNTWVSQPRLQQTPIRDVCVAAVLRLIGRLTQLGIKEKLCKSVQNVAKAMNLFAKHGITEGVPWEVQLSAIYTIYDLAPIDPKEALEALASWRGETTQPVPSGIMSCIMQIGSLCRQIRP
ncbi:little elongation complex subunit 1 isoform X1 [Pygocentrus nattereri]|uniref:Little elongation complex subunit 1 C-terminal domain-containing protein n=2 Tax=Pygocentrus nattereri TaxID=42514 RepID=A0A3B4C0M1_PYGNA|nr:little elongation complex subunit 1 isoform X1 [Pygocentrus nattereri]